VECSGILSFRRVTLGIYTPLIHIHVRLSKERSPSPEMAVSTRNPLLTEKFGWPLGRRPKPHIGFRSGPGRSGNVVVTGRGWGGQNKLIGQARLCSGPLIGSPPACTFCDKVGFTEVVDN
jgi:hypothetical protein